MAAQPPIPSSSEPIADKSFRAVKSWYQFWKRVSDLLDTTVGGTSAFLLKASNLSDVSSAATARSNIGRPKGHLWGFSLANGTDATNDINFGTGVCRDSTDAVDIIAASALVKQLDAAWAAGTNAGGRMSAAAIANGTYFLYAIRKDSDRTVDFGFDVSPTAPTMPSGYTYFRRIGSMLRESATIAATKWSREAGGNLRATRDVMLNDYTASNPGTSVVTDALSVPLGIQVKARFTGRLSDTSPAAATHLIFTETAQTDTAPSGALHDLRIAAAGAGVAQNTSGNFERLTDTSGQIRFRLDASTADHTVMLMLIGWIDDCGVSQ